MSNGKIALFGCGGLIVAFVAYLILGGVSLAMQQESLAGARGRVWNQIETGGELVGRLEGQLEFGVDELAQINEDITTARSEILAAQEVGDLDAALAASGQAGLAIDALWEAYPDYYDMTTVFVGLQDETAEAFNEIEYSRDQLIEAQVRFNRTRIFFAPMMLFFEREDVVGEGFDPTSEMRPSSLGDQ